MVTDTRKILDAATADQDDRVLLQVVAFARNVAGHFEAIGQTHARDLTQCRVRLLRRRRVDARADAALLRTGLQGRHLVALRLVLPGVPDQLVNRRHACPAPFVTLQLVLPPDPPPERV